MPTVLFHGLRNLTRRYLATRFDDSGVGCSSLKISRALTVRLPSLGKITNAVPLMKYIEHALIEIKAWETEKPGFLNQVGDFILRPAEKAAAAMIPASVTEAVGKAVEGCLSALATQTAKTVQKDAIRASVEKATDYRKEGECPSLSEQLESADEEARRIWDRHIGYAIAEGGVTGIPGLPGLVVDIPALLGILIREIQSIACCYGYDPAKESEREYLLHILQTGTATSIGDKAAFVISLKEFEQILLRVAWKHMAGELATKQISKQSLLAAIRQSAKTLGIQITKRKALQTIPVIGALIGASFNGMIANDIGKAAYMSYRRRWIKDRGDSESMQPALIN